MRYRLLIIPFFALLSLLLVSPAQGALTMEPPPQPSEGAPTSFTTLAGIYAWTQAILYWVAAAFWVLAVIFIFYAAYLYLGVGANEKNLEAAGKQFKYAIIAIVVALLSTVLPTLVKNILGGQ